MTLKKRSPTTSSDRKEMLESINGIIIQLKAVIQDHKRMLQQFKQMLSDYQQWRDELEDDDDS